MEAFTVGVLLTSYAKNVILTSSVASSLILHAVHNATDMEINLFLMKIFSVVIPAIW